MRYARGGGARRLQRDLETGGITDRGTLAVDGMVGRGFASRHVDCCGRVVTKYNDSANGEFPDSACGLLARFTDSAESSQLPENAISAISQLGLRHLLLRDGIWQAAATR